MDPTVMLEMFVYFDAFLREDTKLPIVLYFSQTRFPSYRLY